MIDAEEARRIAIDNMGGRDEPGEVLLEEYEDGYVVCRELPEDLDEGARIGTTCVVIDKADGKAYGRPYVGPEETIERWRDAKAAGLI